MFYPDMLLNKQNNLWFRFSFGYFFPPETFPISPFNYLSIWIRSKKSDDLDLEKGLKGAKLILYGGDQCFVLTADFAITAHCMKVPNLTFGKKADEDNLADC